MTGNSPARVNPSSSNRRNETPLPKSLLKRRKLSPRRQRLQAQRWFPRREFLPLACQRPVGFLQSRGFLERPEYQVRLIRQIFLKHLVLQACRILIHRQLRLRLLSHPHQLQVFPPHLVLPLHLVRLEHRTCRKHQELPPQLCRSHPEHQLHLQQSLHQHHRSHRAPRRFLNHHLVPACRLPLPLGSPSRPSRQRRQSLLRMVRRKQTRSS